LLLCRISYNLNIFGPSLDGAQLESSKIFTKELLKENNIPTANFETFDTLEGAKAFLEQAPYPVVVKADVG